MPGSKVKDPNAFPYWQLTVLAICRFSEPIAFNSILAYSYPLVIDLLGGDEDDGEAASFYSGLLVSAYAVAEALTAMFWGSLSDRYGRKPVVLAGLGGVAVSCLILGFAKSFWVALLARFVGGALNGNVSVMQTMVAEIVTNPAHEPAAYATQPFVWTLGGILGSAMGGFLAKPAQFYPHLFPEDGIFGRYPYLLPNLASVFIIVAAIIQGIFLLEETNPPERRAAALAAAATNAKSGPASGLLGASAATDNAIDDDESVADETTPLNPRSSRDARKVSTASYMSVSDSVRPLFAEDSLPVPVGGSFDLRRSSFGTIHSIDVHHRPSVTSVAGPRGLRMQPPPESPSDSGSESAVDGVYTGPVWNRTIIMLVVALTLVAYHQMAFGALLPVHLYADPAPGSQPGRLDLIGGLQYGLHDISVFLSVNGVISLFIQALIFPVFVAWAGVWHTFVSMVILYPTCYLVMPFLSAAPSRAITSAGVYVAMILQALYGIMVVPTALILLKDATPSSQLLGRVNGLAMSACCAARTLSPPLVGVIYSTGGSARAWFSCAAVAFLGAVQLLWVPRKHMNRIVVETSIVGRTVSHAGDDAAERSHA
jgi:MFS family permease